MLAKSIASEKSSLHSHPNRWDWSLQQLQGMRKKGRSRRKGTHLKRTCPIFCPSQHLQGACKDTIFTTRVPTAAACMDIHCSLALLEATLSENLYPNTSRDPAESCLQLLRRNPPQNRALAANSLNRCSATPLDAKGSSAISHSKYGIAHYHHYYSPTWHLWLFTESKYIQVVYYPTPQKHTMKLPFSSPKAQRTK